MTKKEISSKLGIEALTEYEYDKMNRPVSVKTAVGTETVSYDKARRITEKALGATGERVEFGYDSAGLLTKKEISSKLGIEAITAYEYDKNGNLKKKVNFYGIHSKTETYTYTAFGELKTAEGDSFFAEYCYGADGFRSGKKVNGVSTEYVYDDAGNLTSKTTSGDYGAKSESYVYDAFGKLIKYLENGEEKASYKYNGSGQRVEKTVNGAKTKYYWDGANIKNEGTASAVNATNYFGANGVFARKSGSSVNVLYKNGHGDTVLLTSGNTVVRDYEYDAYGAEKNTLSSDDNPFRYSGEYFDSETGFIYLRNRYYDPSSARFISEDTHWNIDNCIYGDYATNTPDITAIAQSTNIYVYCINNPVRYIDGSGYMVADAVISALSTSPVGQQILTSINNMAAEAGMAVSVFIANNLPEIQRMIDAAGNVIPAIWDWTTGTAMPWLSEKAKQVGEAVSNTFEKAGDWVKEKFNNSTNGDPGGGNDKKPSLNKLSDKEAEKIVKEKGFKDLHEFKKGIAGWKNISKFNVAVDKNTGELYLQSVQKGGAIIETGYYK